MDKGQLIQSGNGGKPSIIKIPPPPPPKPSKLKNNGNENGNSNPDLDSNGFPTIPPPPPLPSVTESSQAVSGEEQLAKEVVETAATTATEEAGGGNTVTETIQEEGKTFAGEVKDEFLGTLLGNDEEEEGGGEDEPKSVANLLTKELISLTLGNDEEEDGSSTSRFKPSVVKSNVKKLLPGSKKTEEEETKEDGQEEPAKEEQEPATTTDVEEKEGTGGDENGGDKGEKEEDEDDGDDDDDDEDGILGIFNIKKFILSKLKSLLGQAKPYAQTLLTNVVGVLVGAAVAYSALNSGPEEPCQGVYISNTYKPIQTFTVSPISGIKSEKSQPWITISLDPLIYGIQQADSQVPGALEIESTSLILNVTHRAERETETLPNNNNNNNNNSTNNNKNATNTYENATSTVNEFNLNTKTELNPILRTHVVSFRVKRDLEQEEEEKEEEFVMKDKNDMKMMTNSSSNGSNNSSNNNINNTVETKTTTNSTPASASATTTTTTKSTPQKNEPKVLVIHEQIGTETQFEDFIPLVPEVQEKMTHLYLRYLIISPQQLLESLKFAQKLRELELDQVILRDNFDGRVQLPSIRKFYLHVVNTSSSSEAFIPPLDPIKTFIFFDKNGYWRIEKISSIGVEIDLIFDGRKYFSLNKQKRALASQLLITNLILKNLDLTDFPLENLALSFIEIDIDLIPSTISNLSLYSVTFSNNEKLGNLLTRLTNLTSLEINGLSGHTLILSDLKHIKKLKHLAFGRSNIQLTTPEDLFFKLDSIYLENIFADSNFFTQFHSLFNGTRVAVSALPSIQYSHTFLKNVLQMKAVEWIYMENFDRQPIFIDTTTTTSAIGGQQKKSPGLIDYEEIEWFLINCGVPSTVEVFLLEKNTSNGLWSGHGVTVEEHRYLWFNLFNMEKFWTKSKVDAFNGMKGQKFITYYLSTTAHEYDDELMTINQ